MSNNKTNYPLAWPIGWKRTTASSRRPGRFNRSQYHYTSHQLVDGTTQHNTHRRKAELTVTNGIDRVLVELEKLGVQSGDCIISTNLETRLDGLPRSGQRAPDDSGVAVYWRVQNKSERVLAIDLYTSVADNLAAIAATLNAMRAIERHGSAEILTRVFQGFDALPAPGAHKFWWHVLGVEKVCKIADARYAYKRLAMHAHPDRGGSLEQMQEINAAWEQAQQACT